MKPGFSIYASVLQLCYLDSTSYSIAIKIQPGHLLNGLYICVREKKTFLMPRSFAHIFLVIMCIPRLLSNFSQILIQHFPRILAFKVFLSQWVAFSSASEPFWLPPLVQWYLITVDIYHEGIFGAHFVGWFSLAKCSGHVTMDSPPPPMIKQKNATLPAVSLRTTSQFIANTNFLYIS